MDEYEFTLDVDIPEEILQNIQTNVNADIDVDTSIHSNNHNNDNVEYSSDDTVIYNANNTSVDSDPYESDDYYDNDDTWPFEVEVDRNPADDLPQYAIDNKQFEMNNDDVLNGWVRENNDSGSSCGPFLREPSTIIDLTDPVPELFFNELFDRRMWTIICEATNSYAHSKATTPQGKK